MSRYASDSRDRVRDAVDMVRLVEGRVELRRAGHNSYFGCCPFHDERTASFHVRPDEKHYHCFGCSESGDPFDFVMATEGLDFVGALESLANRFGVSLETVDEDPEAAARRARRERLYSLLTRTATFYERMLWESREGERARRYLREERGLAEEILRRFRVGWAPDAWDRVLIGSRAAGFSDAEMLAAGLIQRSRKDSSRLYDRFRAQIMFPTADARGRVIGFGARKPPGDDRDWLGKYINTAEGEIYSKRAVLYGIHEARGPAAKAAAMVLAEGYTDVIALHQAGITNAVGIMGTSLTKEQVTELRRLAGTLLLCLDADNAGQDAMARAAALCAETGLELRVVALPPGADPGELIKSGGAEALAGVVATSAPYVVFEVERILTRADLSSAEGKDRAISLLAPALARVPESVQRDELLRRIAGALGVEETRLAGYLGRAAGSGGGLTGPPPSRNGDGAGRGAAAPSRDRRRAPEPGVTTERQYLAMCLAAGEAGRGELVGIDPDALLTSAVLRRAVRRLTGQLEIAGTAAAVAPDGAAGSPQAEYASGTLAEYASGPPTKHAAEALAADGDPRLGVAVSDEQVSAAIDDLESRAQRATSAGRRVSAEELQHARLLLELARVERQLQSARVAGQGVAPLAAQRQQVRLAIGEVAARISSRNEPS